MSMVVYQCAGCHTYLPYDQAGLHLGKLVITCPSCGSQNIVDPSPRCGLCHGPATRLVMRTVEEVFTQAGKHYNAVFRCEEHWGCDEPWALGGHFRCCKCTAVAFYRDAMHEVDNGEAIAVCPRCGHRVRILPKVKCALCSEMATTFVVASGNSIGFRCAAHEGKRALNSTYLGCMLGLACLGLLVVGIPVSFHSWFGWLLIVPALVLGYFSVMRFVFVDLPSSGTLFPNMVPNWDRTETDGGCWFCGGALGEDRRDVPVVLAKEGAPPGTVRREVHVPRCAGCARAAGLLGYAEVCVVLTLFAVVAGAFLVPIYATGMQPPMKQIVIVGFPVAAVGGIVGWLVIHHTARKRYPQFRKRDPNQFPEVLELRNNGWRVVAEAPAQRRA